MDTKRKVHINGVEWHYAIGSKNVVIKHPQTNKKIVASFSSVTGRSWDVIERGRWKGTDDCAVTPADVKNFIETKILTE